MRRSWFALMALAVVAGVVVQGGGAARASGAPPQFSRGTRQAIDAIVREAMAAGQMPGVTIGVWVGGRGTYVRSYGVASLGSGRAMTPDLHVRIASVTKTFAATAVLRLVDMGLLSLDDKLSSFVKGIDNGNKITVRQLLNMTSGVFSFTEDEAFLAKFNANPLMKWSAQDALAVVRRHEPDFAPGASWHYSDSNYVLLGLILEKVTGRSSAQVIEREVLKPLGLDETSVPSTPAIPAPRSHGYVALTPGAALREVTAVNPDVAGPAGNMISTVDDLGRYAKALATGTLLSRKVQKERLDLVDIGASPTLSTGYGLGLFEIQGFLGHTGAILGFSTMMFHLPDKDATIVVMGNQATNFSEPTFPIFYEVAKLLFPARFPA